MSKDRIAGWEYDRPFYAVKLLPVDKPTAEQIKVFRELGYGQREANFLQLRDTLQNGGFAGFGLLLASEKDALTRTLAAVGIPFQVLYDNTPRMLPAKQNDGGPT